jgi:two-component system chemotaxis response regulator CheY
MRSFVAEDDATTRLVLKTVLSRYGECDTAEDGKKAVEAVNAAIVSKKNYDLVCMDLRLPEMDGHAAIREIRKSEGTARVSNAVKIIVTTAHDDTDSIARAVMGRCNAYLVKPIDIAKLKKELKALGLEN